jgi:hypothetical protein
LKIDDRRAAENRQIVVDPPRLAQRNLIHP